jgi:MoxR-like ATPase
MKITLVVGAPGTGKTYRIRRLKELIDCIVFCPTNSSAELCGGMTVYKYLNCTPYSIRDTKPIPFKSGLVVIFDEIFMFDSVVFDKVVECKPSRIICFGDPF